MKKVKANCQEKILELIPHLNKLRIKDPWTAAKVCYLIATLYRRCGDKKKALSFARKTIILLEQGILKGDHTNGRTQPNIAGVSIPAHLNKEVIKNQFFRL